MQRLKRMARYWDMFANSGNFRDSITMLWRSGSPFQRLIAFADFIYQRTGKTHQIALPRQFDLLLEHLGNTAEAGRSLAADYLRPGRRDLPESLQAYAVRERPERKLSAPTRQQRHLHP